jgi:hypothetical protein
MFFGLFKKPVNAMELLEKADEAHRQKIKDEQFYLQNTSPRRCTGVSVFEDEIRVKYTNGNYVTLPFCSPENMWWFITALRKIDKNIYNGRYQ